MQHIPAFGKGERKRKGALHVPDAALIEMYRKGGTWRLTRGDDFDGSVSSVDDQIRKTMKRIHGDWRVRKVDDNTFEISIDAPENGSGW